MKLRNRISYWLVPLLAGCAARPVYFGADAVLTRGDSERYWLAPASSPPCLQAGMRRRLRAAPGEGARYAGTLTVRGADAVALSTFSVAEGGSALFHYDWNAGVERELALSGRATRYEPGLLDVVVTCARGACRAESTPPLIRPDGTVSLKARKVRDAARLAQVKLESLARRRRREERAARAEEEKSLARDRACAALLDGLEMPEGCAAWLEGRGGVGAARRRIRLAQWTTISGEQGPAVAKP
jgi:hypothetical protein